MKSSRSSSTGVGLEKEGFCEFKDNLGNTVSSGLAGSLLKSKNTLERQGDHKFKASLFLIVSLKPHKWPETASEVWKFSICFVSRFILFHLRIFCFLWQGLLQSRLTLNWLHSGMQLWITDPSASASPVQGFQVWRTHLTVAQLNVWISTPQQARR